LSIAANGALLFAVVEGEKFITNKLQGRQKAAPVKQ